MNKLRILIILITVVSLTGGYILSPEKKLDEKEYLKEIAPNIEFSEKTGTPPHYQSAQGIIAFNSYDIVPWIRGYAGPIKLLIVLDRKGKITGIKIIDHRETKNYVHYMVSPEYLNQFIGKSVNDPFEINKDIDAISRATVSLQALVETVRESSRIVASQVYGFKIKGKGLEKGLPIDWIIYLLLFLTAFAFHLITKTSKRLLRTRDFTLILGIVIIGIYLSTPFSILHVFNLTLLRLSSSLLWYVIIISTFFSVVVAGRFYCGWLCPFGALAEFISRIPFKKWELSIQMDTKWRRLKYILLGLIIIVVFLSKHIEYGNFETYVTLFSFHGNFLTWSLVVLMLLINIRIERFWCRYMCPVAAFMGLLCREDAGYISKKDCPMVNKPDPLISECIRCNRCYTKPPN
jgi:Na+-translocating ferredoxin:NAD+ oxidoreductase RnfG subunit